MRSDQIAMYNYANGSLTGDMSGPLTFGVKGPAGQLAQPLSLRQLFGYAIQPVFTTAGSLAGTFQLQASVDGINFDPITGTLITISGAGNRVLNAPNPMYQFVNLLWTPTGTVTGTLSCQAFVRGI